MKTETDLKSDRKGRNEKEREDWKDAKKKRLDDI